MPIFHFNTRTGDDLLPDPEGEDLADLNAARAVAVASAQEVLAEAAKFGQRPPEFIQITDEEGREVATVPVLDVLNSGTS
jgi:hypothetical protein